MFDKETREKIKSAISSLEAAVAAPPNPAMVALYSGMLIALVEQSGLLKEPSNKPVSARYADPGFQAVAGNPSQSTIAYYTRNLGEVG